MGWDSKFADSEWPEPFDKAADAAMEKASSVPEGWIVSLEKLKNQGWDISKLSVDLTSQPDKAVLSKCSHHTELKKEGSNLIDSEGYLYFQCSKCLNIFDPQTKNFGLLNDTLDAAQWKRVWNEGGLGFKIYCVECK